MNYLNCFDDIKFIKRILNTFDENVMNIILRFLSEKDIIVFLKKVKSTQLPNASLSLTSSTHSNLNLSHKPINYCLSHLDYPVPVFSSKKYKTKSKKNLNPIKKQKSRYNLRVYIYEECEEEDYENVKDEVNECFISIEHEDYTHWLID